MKNKIVLKKGKEFPLRKFHPWVFSGAIDSPVENLKVGDLVEVYSQDNQYLAQGYWNAGGIAVKVLSFHKCEIDISYWQEKIYKAKSYRMALGLLDNPNTNAFRIFNAEGDGVPGLIIDKYSDAIVVQLQSLALDSYKDDIFEALKSNFPAVTSYILNTPLKSEVFYGDAEVSEILENGMKFKVDLLRGQKTGFFLDQRDNRLLISKLSEGKSVLNLFSYSGGFSIAALSGKAEKVISVDSSKDAICLLESNLALNCYQNNHNSVTEDVFDYLNSLSEKFDFIVCDPPAFCKHRDAVENAAKAYSSLNQQAMLKLKPGGVLFTFSCSQLVSKERFKEAVLIAASRAGKHFRIAGELQAACCHPLALSHPEGEYLKGIFLVEAG